MFKFSGREACGLLAPQPRIEPTLPALEDKVLTTAYVEVPALIFLKDLLKSDQLAHPSQLTKMLDCLSSGSISLVWDSVPDPYVWFDALGSPP